jgi:hypothetical protein
LERDQIHIAYNSDLLFVAQTMQKITEEEIGEEMMERVGVFRDLLAKTPVDELQVREHPRVIFRVSESTLARSNRALSRAATRSRLHQDPAHSETSRSAECRAKSSDVPERRRALTFL